MKIVLYANYHIDQSGRHATDILTDGFYAGIKVDSHAKVKNFQVGYWNLQSYMFGEQIYQNVTVGMTSCTCMSIHKSKTPKIAN